MRDHVNPQAGGDRVEAARKTPVTRLMDSEAQLDMKRLRAYRLGRVRQQLAAREIAACVLFNPISIRYASGLRNCAVFQTHIVSGFLFVAAEGPVILYDSEPGKLTGGDLETIDEIRDLPPLSYMFAGPRLDDWMTRWAGEMQALLQAYGGGNKRLAVERAGTRAPLALAVRGIEVLDGMDVVESARTIKSAEEILCMNQALAVAEAGIDRMRAALRPGISEIELWSLLHQTNIEMGGDWIECRLLSAGDRTNPWQQEASGRLVRPGELVAFDTDMVGPFGYCADVSRTFHCGPGRPSDAQRDLYRRAVEEIQHNLTLIEPGLGFREFSEKAFRQEDRFIANRYPVLAHGIGMCDEYPAIYYPQDYPICGYDGVIEENMTLCIESYVGEEGGGEGVKLEEQILVTADGYALLSKYPFEEALLA
jgi:Xaa-Pro aminopeptidase